MESISKSVSKDYVIEKKIYENPDAKTSVYEARDMVLNRTVILKSIGFENNEARKGIIREVCNQVLIEKYSDFVPRIYNMFEDRKESLIWIEMQQIPGRRLRDIMEENAKTAKTKFWYDNVYDLLCDICKSVSYIHKAEKFVHKDLKPENIIVNRSRKCVYIVDFGISGPWMNKGIGTEKYMAPEQRSQVDRYYVSQATDVFALGQIAYEMFAGKTLVYGKDLIYNPTGNEWLKMSGVEEADNPYYPNLKDIIIKCIAMDPKKRYRNAGDIFSELQKYRRGSKRTSH